MTRYAWLLLASALGCGDDDDVGTMIDPSDVAADDLYGYWSDEPLMGSSTVLAFYEDDRERAEYTLPLNERNAEIDLDVDGPYGVVFAGGAPNFSLIQMTQFSVEDGALLQTVIADVGAIPGMMYSTEIFSLQRRTSLELSSTRVPEGRRTYTWSAECPATEATGWQSFRGQICPTAVSTATSILVDDEGDVHAYSGVGASEGVCPPVPTFTDWAGACVPRQTATENATLSSMTERDGVLRRAYVASDFSLHVAERPLRGFEWTDTIVDPIAQASSGLHMFETPTGRVIVLVETPSRKVMLFRSTGGTFTKESPRFPSGDDLSEVLDAAIDRDGRLALLSRNSGGETNGEILRETASGWERTPLPRYIVDGFGGTVFVDDDGRVHAAWSYDEDTGTTGGGGMVLGGFGVYGVLDGGAWTTHELGPLVWPIIVTEPDGEPLQVVGAAQKSPTPLLALVTVDGDALSADALLPGGQLGSGLSPESFVQPRAHRGANGTIAATFDGQRIFARGPETPARPDVPLTLDFDGDGAVRVRSADGLIDCSSDCTVMVPPGRRHRVRFEAEAGNAIVQFPCLPGHTAKYGWCWFDRPEDGRIPLRTAITPIASILGAGDARGGAVTERFAVEGEHIAIAAAFNAGVAELPVGGVTLTRSDASTTYGIAAFDRTSRTGWVRSLSIAASAVAPSTDGGAYALLVPTAQIDVDGTNLGGTGVTPALLELDPDGEIERVLPLHEPIADGASYVAGAVSHDGAAVAILTASGGFPSLSMPDEKAIALFLAPGGAPRVVALGVDEYVQSGEADIDAARAAVVLLAASASHVITIESLAAEGAAFAGARAIDVDLRGERVLALYEGALESETGPLVVAEHAVGGELVRASSLMGSGGRDTGLVAIDGGALVLSQRVVRRFDAALEEVGDLTLPFSGPITYTAPHGETIGAVGGGGYSDYPIPELEGAYTSIVSLTAPAR